MASAVSKRSRKVPGELMQSRAEIREAIGQLVRQWRGDRGVSWLAGRFREIGARPAWWDYRAVWRLETGKGDIGIEDLPVIADAFSEIPGALDQLLAPLMPKGEVVPADELRDRIIQRNRETLEREARRLERTISETMNDPEFRTLVGALATLSDRRRQIVTEVVQGLRLKDRSEGRRPVVETDMREVFVGHEPAIDAEIDPRAIRARNRAVNSRTTKGQGGPKRKK